MPDNNQVHSWQGRLAAMHQVRTQRKTKLASRQAPLRACAREPAAPRTS